MKSVKTARGRIIDMGALRTKFEETRAVSNVPVNARGDIIDNRGNITVSRENVSKAYYKDTVVGAEEKISIKQESKDPDPIVEIADKQPEPEVAPAPAKTTKTKSQTTKVSDEITEVGRRQRTRDDGSSYWEIEYSDGSMTTEEE
jgi:hypothetical protein